MDDKTTFAPNDFRNVVPRFAEEARKSNLALIHHLKILADAHRATPAQVALAWLLAQKPWIVPIPGTTKTHQLQENLESVSLSLSSDDLFTIDQALAQIKLVGERYPESAQKMIDRLFQFHSPPQAIPWATCPDAKLLLPMLIFFRGRSHWMVLFST